MNKKSYIKPLLVVVKIDVQNFLATSQYDVPVNKPSDEVDAGDAL
jgi:hypothetical protein